MMLGSWNESWIHCVKLSWNNQFWKEVSHGGVVSIQMYRGLERRQFCTKLHFSSQGSWKEFNALWWKPVWLLLWLISPVCKVLGVRFPAIVLKVMDVTPLSMSWGLMEAGSDLCLFLPVGEESSEWGSTDDSLDDKDAGGEYEGDLGEYSCWGDGNGDKGGVWCMPASSNIMDLASMSANVYLEGHNFHLCWFGVLKGVNFRLLSLFFHWMVLKWHTIIANGF